MRLGLGEKGDDGKVVGEPAPVEVDGEGDRGGQRQGERVLFAEQPDDRGVLKSVAGVFPAGDIGVQILFGYGNPQFQRREG